MPRVEVGLRSHGDTQYTPAAADWFYRPLRGDHGVTTTDRHELGTSKAAAGPPASARVSPRSMRSRRFVPLVLVLLAVAGCASIRLATGAAVRTALRADRVSISPGEAVRFVAAAKNPTADRVLLGETCGSALDVLVTQPGGASQSVQVAEMGAEFSANCRQHEHIVGPGDSSVVTLRWVAPEVRGEYLARAGLRGPSGFSNLSDPIRVVVE